MENKNLKKDIRPFSRHLLKRRRNNLYENFYQVIFQAEIVLVWSENLQTHFCNLYWGEYLANIFCLAKLINYLK